MKILTKLTVVGMFCLLSGPLFAQSEVGKLPVPHSVPPKVDVKKAEPKKEESKKDEPYILSPCEKKCPQCGKKVCRVEYKMEKAKKTVYEIECKEVCIPDCRLIRVPSLCCKSCGKCKLFGKCHCPKDCGCGEPRCGRVRTVKILRKKVIDCGEVCKCKWHIESCPEPCHQGCASGCEVGCSGAIPIPTDVPVIDVFPGQPAPVEQVVPSTTESKRMPYATGATRTTPIHSPY